MCIKSYLGDFEQQNPDYSDIFHGEVQKNAEVAIFSI